VGTAVGVVLADKELGIWALSSAAEPLFAIGSDETSNVAALDSGLAHVEELCCAFREELTLTSVQAEASTRLSSS
jgi:hypothetical protein